MDILIYRVSLNIQPLVLLSTCGFSIEKNLSHDLMLSPGSIFCQGWLL